jgi:hypothetical protein
MESSKAVNLRTVHRRAPTLRSLGRLHQESACVSAKRLALSPPPKVHLASRLEYPLQDNTLSSSLRRATAGGHVTGECGLAIREV